MKAGSWGVLVRLFAFRFYQEQLGFLLLVFGVIFSHLFWIKPLGGHLNHEDSVRFHLILLYSFASEPLLLLVFLLFWIVYAGRVVGYMKRQLKLEPNQFLFYSTNALASSKQIRIWFGVFTVIFTPAILLTLGIVYAGCKYAETSLLIYYPMMITLLCWSIAVWVVQKLNHGWGEARNSLLSISFQKIKKPLWCIPLLNFLFHQKLVFLLVKLLSIALAISGIILLKALTPDVRVLQMITLSMAMINSYLVYAVKKYEDGFLAFSRNFPETRAKILGRIWIRLLVLYLPELILILISFPIQEWIPLWALLLGMGGFLEALLLRLGEIQQFYQVVFGIYFGGVILILGGYGVFLLLVVPVSMILVRRFYYKNNS